MKLQTNPFPFWQNMPNEIDSLIDKLSEHGFNPDFAPATDIWHKYDLPYIGISDEDKPIIKENLFDGVLGIYQTSDFKWEKEGRIVLFRKAIEEVAEKYTKDFNLPSEECLINLTKIVLLHEVGHWIFHCMSTDKSKFNTDYSLINNQLHEAFAQYLVVKGIGDNASMKEMFDWLIKGNPPYDIILDFDIEALVIIREKDTCPKTIEDFNEFLNKRRGQIASSRIGLL